MPDSPSLTHAVPSYEADRRGNVYERENGAVWPTGIRVRAWAGRNDITHEEFLRRLRWIDEQARMAR